ncbi:hypothetical protein [Soonwooa purpurea]
MKSKITLFVAILIYGLTTAHYLKVEGKVLKNDCRNFNYFTRDKLSNLQ